MFLMDLECVVVVVTVLLLLSIGVETPFLIKYEIIILLIRYK